MLGHHERKNMAISKSGLPAKVLELFDPREDLTFMPPIVKKKPALGMLGVAPFVGHFPDPDDPEYEPAKNEIGSRQERAFRSREYAAQVSIEAESILERRERKARARQAAEKLKLEAALAAYDPKHDPNATGDPMKTLFVSRIDYKVDEEQLKAEFAEFGPIVRVKLVRDREGKSRGYAFIEFEHQGDMKTAYKALPNGKKINGVRVCVDVERGRTVPDWRPRRLGGGKGGEGRMPREKQDKGAAAMSLLAPPPAVRGPVDAPPPYREAPREYGDRDRLRRDAPERPREYARDRPRANGDLPPPPRGELDRSSDRYNDRDRSDRRDRHERSDRMDRGARDSLDDRKRERSRYGDDDRDYKRSRTDDRDRRR